jgi:hypothetical protein
MWYDRDDKVIAIENRPGFRKAFERRTVRSQAMEQSRAGYSYADEVKHFPKLEIVAQVDDKMQDLLVAVWMARVNQEAVFLHPTTMPIRLQGNWDTNS